VRGLEDVRMRCMDRCKWRLFCCGQPLVGVTRNRCQCRYIETDRLSIKVMGVGREKLRKRLFVDVTPRRIYQKSKKK